MPADYTMRQLSADDEPMLWEALYQGLHSAAGAVPPPRDIVQRPELARYVAGWGREGDRGFVAFDAETSGLLGAVWFREPTSTAPRPELVVVVAPGQRKRGIGAALLTQWVRANPEQSEVALRMNASNPAVRLYERFGFRVVAEDDGVVTLRRELGG
jgi:GNAT superfamily N-acetyltransferase